MLVRMRTGRKQEMGRLRGGESRKYMRPQDHSSYCIGRGHQKVQNQDPCLILPLTWEHCKL